MPTKLRRISVTLPEQIEEQLVRAATIEDRPLSAYILRIVRQYFQEHPFG